MSCIRQLSGPKYMSMPGHDHCLFLCHRCKPGILLASMYLSTHVHEHTVDQQCEHEEVLRKHDDHAMQ